MSGRQFHFALVDKLTGTGRVNNNVTVDLRQVQKKVTVDAPAHNMVFMSAAGSVCWQV
jgi:hypothetical protein